MERLIERAPAEPRPIRSNGPATLLATVVAACLTTSVAYAQRLAGTYVDSSGPDRLTVDLYVDDSGHLTGRALHGVLEYLEGSYADGRGEGRLFGAHFPRPRSFVLSIDGDLLALHVFEGTEAPPELPRPRYLLRQPGEGPIGPMVPPLSVLLSEGRGESVIARGPGGELELRDAERFMELLQLALSEAGLPGGVAGTAYLSWIGRLAERFPDLHRETQARLAASDSFWPSTVAGWGSASAEVRRRLSEDVLLIAFGGEQVAAWLGDARGGEEAPHGQSCSTLEGCVTRFFDEGALEAARRAPCLSLEGCSDGPPHPCP